MIKTKKVNRKQYGGRRKSKDSVHRFKINYKVLAEKFDKYELKPKQNDRGIKPKEKHFHHVNRIPCFRKNCQMDLHFTASEIDITHITCLIGSQKEKFDTKVGKKSYY